MKKIITNHLRTKKWQPVWSKFRHFSTIFMNYYGGSDLMESGELSVLNLVKAFVKNVESPVVFDVGANDGKYVKQALNILPTNTRYYCFEPSTKAYLSLSTAVAGNAQVNLFKTGVGEKEEKLTLRAPLHGSVLASLHVHNTNEQSVSEEIEMTSLDQFCLQREIPQIHFLKMDIEGHEVAALKGASSLLKQGKISMIQFEFGQPNISSRTFLKDFYSILGNRYEIHRIVKDGIVSMGNYNEENEVFLTANYLAILKS